PEPTLVRPTGPPPTPDSPMAPVIVSRSAVSAGPGDRGPIITLGGGGGVGGAGAKVWSAAKAARVMGPAPVLAPLTFSRAPVLTPTVRTPLPAMRNFSLRTVMPPWICTCAPLSTVVVVTAAGVVPPRALPLWMLRMPWATRVPLANGTG